MPIINTVLNKWNAIFPLIHVSNYDWYLQKLAQAPRQFIKNKSSDLVGKFLLMTQDAGMRNDDAFSRDFLRILYRTLLRLFRKSSRVVSSFDWTP